MPDDELGLADEQRAYEAREVKQFLAHRAVLAAFAATEERIVKQWKVAPTPLEREMAWHKYQAFQELKRELRATGDRPALALTGN